jgi:putative nucleotidyltransferase with HDIG domain
MGSNVTRAVVARVAEELDRLPAQPLIAVQVLRLVGADASAAALGNLVEVDPALAARVMRLANSPYYGMSGKVRHPAAAVVLLGVKTVQAMAMAASSGLLEGEDDYGDVGWVHALGVGAACRVVARAVRAPEAEAFNAGLLHDIGTTLLDRVDPEAMARVADRVAAGESRVGAERVELGTDHCEVGAAALQSWRFPTSLVRAVANQHGPVERRIDTLARVLAAGEAVAGTLDSAVGDHEGDPVAAVAHLGLKADDLGPLAVESARELDRLLGSITKGARP